MALDFPANPVNGQVYDSYYYDSSMGTWRAQGSGLALNVFTNPTITGGTISGLTSDLAVADGGTGASDPTNARINLGAAATSHQHSGADITSGSVAIANGGTGATTVAGAQDNLGVGLVNVVPSSVTVSSGSASVSLAGVVTLSGGANTITLNNVFSSLYRNYLVQINVFGSTGTPSWFMRLSSGGTPITTASYTYSLTRLTSSATIANQYSGNSANGIYVFESDSAQLSGFSSANINVFNPFLTQYTTVQSQSIGGWSGAGYNLISSAGVHDNVSRDGFCIYSGGTITSGTIQVFGYNN